MTTDELQSHFTKLREEFIDHKARVESNLEELNKNVERNRQDMNEGLRGIRVRVRELSDNMPTNGWKSKAAIGGGTGGAVLLIHAILKILGIEI